MSRSDGIPRRATMAEGISCFICYFSVSLSLCLKHPPCPEAVRRLGVFPYLESTNTLQAQCAFPDPWHLEKQVKPAPRFTPWFLA